MSDTSALAGLLGHNWLGLCGLVVALCLAIIKVAETSEAAKKILGPLGKWIDRKARDRAERYRIEVTEEAKKLAGQIVPTVVADYQVVKEQLLDVVSRVDELQVENGAMRGFIVYDEDWHFHDALAKASSGYHAAGDLGERVPYLTFVTQWKTGWRPRVLGDNK